MAVCLECLREYMGCRMPWVLLEAGAETQPASVLSHEMAIFKLLTVRCFSRWRERLQQMNEWGISVAQLWAAALIPVLFSLKRPCEISFLPFMMSLSFQYGARLGRHD